MKDVKKTKSKTSSKSKQKYNRQTYKRYEVNIRIDSKLNAILERYREEYPNGSISELVKIGLCMYFGMHRDDADMVYVPYHFRRDERIPNNELDKYFSGLEQACE